MVPEEDTKSHNGLMVMEPQNPKRLENAGSESFLVCITITDVLVETITLPP